MIKKIILIFSIVITFYTNALSKEISATQYIDKFTNDIFKIVKQKKDIIYIREELSTYIKENIDIKWVAKFVLGKNWRRINNRQKNQFIYLFEQYLINNYTPKFTGYNDETYKINSTKTISPNKYISDINIKLNNETEIKIAIFFIKNKAQNFKIVDISGEGISFAATQRSEFNSLISTHGINKFFIILEEKVNNNTPSK